MKYLIFGDVHGNLPALEKMLQNEKGNYDRVVFHGDIINYGPWSNECVDMLSDVPNIIKIRGNHELDFLKGGYSGCNLIAREFFDFCYSKFSRFEEIRKYQEHYDLGKYVVKHTINDSYLYPDTDLSQFTLTRNFIIGHSHYQFDRAFGNRRIVNTGSVGQNRKRINVAEYVLYDERKDIVTLKAFQYDINIVIQKMEAEGYPPICVDYYKSKMFSE